MSRTHARSRAIHDVIGVLIAAGAILIYGLSCRPAWEPSGKRVAFPYRDGERSGVALYDLGAGHARRLVEEPGEALASAQCVWSANGRWLYLLHTLDDRTLRLLRVDPGNGKAEKVVDIGGLDDPHTVYPPALVGDRWLWVSAVGRQEGPENGAFRVDLAKRRAEYVFADDKLETLVVDGGSRGAFYVRGANDQPIEVGRVDSNGPRLIPLFTMPAVESAPLPSVEPHGDRLAWFLNTSAGPQLRVSRETGETLAEIPLPSGIDDVAFAAWTSGGIVAAAERRGEGKPKEHGLLGVDLQSRQTRFVPFGTEVADEPDTPMLQPAASPDGRRVAVAVSAVHLSRGEPAALLIFDTLKLDADPVRVGLPPPSGTR
jgi:hypothetical protein